MHVCVVTFAVITCGPYPDIPSTISSNMSMYNTYGSAVEYNCEQGYTYAAGDRIRTCGSDGNWDGQDMICISNILIFL